MSSGPPRSPLSIGTEPPQPLVFEIWGPIARGDMPGLCDRVCSLLGSTGADVAFVDVSSVPADAVTVDALARLQLAARGRGCQVRLREASPDLRMLVEFMGLSDVLVSPGEAGDRRAGTPSRSPGRT